MSAARGDHVRSATRRRISGPMLDRIDLQIEVLAVSAADLVLPKASEGSVEVRPHVALARAIQSERFAGLGCLRIRTDAECDGALLEEVASPEPAGLTLLRGTAAIASPARSQISAAPSKSVASISPRLSAIAARRFAAPKLPLNHLI